MGIPPKTPLHMIPFHRPVSRNDVFNSGSQKMAIMRKSTKRVSPRSPNMLDLKSNLRGKGRAIIECIARSIFGKFYLSLKCLDLFPALEDVLLFFWKIDGHDRNCGGGSQARNKLFKQNRPRIYTTRYLGFVAKRLDVSIDLLSRNGCVNRRVSTPRC